MPLERDAIEASLLKKGFVMTSGDHRFYELVVLGKKTGVGTKISMGTSYKTYSDSLLAKIAKQLNITKSQLVELVNCPLSATDLQRILVTNGVLDEDEVPSDALPTHVQTADYVNVAERTVRLKGRTVSISPADDDVTRHICGEDGKRVGSFTVISDESGWKAWGTDDLGEIGSAWVNACTQSGVTP